MGRGKRMMGTPRPASEKTPGHREENKGTRSRDTGDTRTGGNHLSIH